MNNNNQDTDELDMLAIDIIDAGEDITEEQLDLVKKNSVLRARCQQLLDIKSVYHRSEFNHKNIIKTSNKKHKTITFSLIAVAAVFIGLIIVVNLLQTNVPTTNNEVFVAKTVKPEISITKENGEKLNITTSPRQSSSISIDDYREAMKNDVEKLIVNVPYGKSTDIVLPDGSIVYLHPGSRLTFPTSFLGDKRVVKLEGEAYFKVSKDKSHPFVVIADKLETTVLGTEFNVCKGEVTLITGKVKVRDIMDGTTLSLIPGQQIKQNDQGLSISNVDVQPYQMWRDGYLYYDNVEMCDIMRSLGENYNMTIEFNDTKEMHQKMRFFAERNGGIDQAIKMMNRMKKVNVYRHGNSIIVD